MLMRVGFIFVVTCLIIALMYLLVFVAIPAKAGSDFTWEGELDPNDIVDNWKKIGFRSDLRGFVWVMWQNPNSGSLIEVVLGEVDFEGGLFTYRYFKYGMPYTFYFDDKENKYVQYKFTDEEKKSCMRCHGDKVKPLVELKIVKVKKSGIKFTSK